MPGPSDPPPFYVALLIKPGLTPCVDIGATYGQSISLGYRGKPTTHAKTHCGGCQPAFLVGTIAIGGSSVSTFDAKDRPAKLRV